ncbi:MAG: ATP synthase F1 subunit gamma [Clostridium sp.]|uniref:ATP synthase F1 subunit gamma n=1 Tax=Clostridium sp. TaxID=1506 RepID=UPI003F3C6F1B
MPAAGLLDIKRRIKSVQSTQKITKAMALVSTSKLTKARMNLDSNNLYFQSLDDMKKELLKIFEEFSENEFVCDNGQKKKLYVIFASNSGLCGGFNGSGALYLSDKYPKNEREEIETLIIGDKGVSYAKKYGFTVKDKISTIKDGIELKDARHIASDLMRAYASGEYGEVNFIYTKYISPIQQDIMCERILPFNIESKDEEKEITDNIEKEDLFDLDEDEDEDEDVASAKMIESFVYRYMEGKIINTVYHSQTSEQNARMQAMDGATKNADDILDALNTKYNRIRQSAITQEISEIVGGAEAQK